MMRPQVMGRRITMNKLKPSSLLIKLAFSARMSCSSSSSLTDDTRGFVRFRCYNYYVSYYKLSVCDTICSSVYSFIHSILLHLIWGNVCSILLYPNHKQCVLTHVAAHIDGSSLIIYLFIYFKNEQPAEIMAHFRRCEKSDNVLNHVLWNNTLTNSCTRL